MVRTQDPLWLETIEVVATDLAESYRRGMAGHLDHAVRVADPFHVVRAANRCVDKVRRRVQNETLGHRGRKGDPLYRIRKLLLAGAERLDERGHERMLLGLRRGDPHDELLGAWLAKESVRDVYLTERVGEARTLLRKAIVGCKGDEVPEIRSLGDTLERWSDRDLEPSPHRCLQRSHRGHEPVREEDQARRPWLLLLRALPPACPPPCGRCALAQASLTASDQNPRSLLQRVEPQKASSGGIFMSVPARSQNFVPAACPHRTSTSSNSGRTCQFLGRHRSAVNLSLAELDNSLIPARQQSDVFEFAWLKNRLLV